MKRFSQFLAICLTVIILGSSLPTEIFAEGIYLFANELGQESIQSGAIIEDISRREENTKHFILPDGSYQAVIYSEAIHRKDEEGVWQDIDNRLSLSTENNSGRYVTLDGRSSFTKNFAADRQLFVLEENGYSVSFSFQPNTNLEVMSSKDTIKATAVPNYAPIVRYFIR